MDRRSASPRGDGPQGKFTRAAEAPARGQVTWEYREIALPRGTAREAAQVAFVEAAEHDRWELARLRLYPDGRRRAWLRRRILRVTRTA